MLPLRTDAQYSRSVQRLSQRPGILRSELDVRVDIQPGKAMGDAIPGDEGFPL
jgi:hypothetical protein